jgi:hypothetical protein
MMWRRVHVGAGVQVEMFDYSESCSAALKWDLPAEDHGMAASEYEVETRVYGGPIHSVRASRRRPLPLTLSFPPFFRTSEGY